MANSANASLYPNVLLTAQQVGECLSVSSRSIWRYDAVGAIPRPIRRGRLVRWRADEIAAWINAGCPDRKVWELRRDLDK